MLARAAQGAAAAFMVPQILATIQATSTGPARTRALAAYGATGGIAMVVGQALGGALVSWNIAGSGWRPIFLVNVPIGLVTLVLAARLLPETKAAKASRPDIPGSLLLAATVLAVVVPAQRRPGPRLAGCGPGRCCIAAPFLSAGCWPGPRPGWTGAAAPRCCRRACWNTAA